MIFPLAKENLRQFWVHENPSSVTPEWCLEEMAGIATALSYLHNDLVTQDSRPMSGWHMDLKPENILVEKDPSASKLTFKISDFGSSYIYPKGSRLELPPHPGLGTYEPPECQLNLPQSQAYDIWSLGCVFLECLIWLMKGSNAIEAFAEDRLNHVTVSDTNLRDDCFFTLESDKPSESLRAITRPAVIKWIDDLDHDAKCSEEISLLLHLIKSGLLQVDQSRRLKADHLSQEMELLHDTVKRFLESDPIESLPRVTSNAQITELED
jgi:serine/threonine protein kinase